MVALTRGHARILLVPRHVCRWGGFGIVQGTFECLRAALRCGVPFDYGVLLSGQDYLTQPLDRLVARLAAPARSEFIESFRLDLPNRWSGHSGVYHPANKVSWFSVPIRSRWLHIPVHRRLPFDMKAHGGSQWWCLSRDCLAHIEDFVSRRPRVLNYFRNVFIPDELIFQTSSPTRRSPSASFPTTFGT